MTFWAVNVPIRKLFEEKARISLKISRILDVICCDQTRVKIQDGDPNDYIHANWVKGLNANMVLTQVREEQFLKLFRDGSNARTRLKWSVSW